MDTWCLKRVKDCFVKKEEIEIKQISKLHTHQMRTYFRKLTVKKRHQNKLPSVISPLPGSYSDSQHTSSKSVWCSLVRSQLTCLSSGGKHQGPSQLLEFEGFVRSSQVLYRYWCQLLKIIIIIISGKHCTEKISFGSYQSFCHRAPEIYGHFLG